MRFWTERTKIMENPAYTIGERIRASRERSLLGALTIGTAAVVLSVAVYALSIYVGVPLIVPWVITLGAFAFYIFSIADLTATHIRVRKHLREIQKKRNEEEKKSEKDN